MAAAQVLEGVGVAPRLVGQYVDRRASGHAAWIETIGRLTNRVMQAVDRGETLPRLDLPDWAGARAEAPAGPPGATTSVRRPEQLHAAMAAARPGDVIVLAPGIYRFAGTALETPRGGTEAQPITVRADTFGSVTLEFDLVEGFLVTTPFWRFENLVVRGVCARHIDCEHAFHVVGEAHHVVIQNNLVSDFNAHVKINGRDGRFPDHGRIARNTLVNGAPRRTVTPVTPIDLVAASNWTIEANLIADFVKANGDFTSYGAFAKGAGHGNQFLRNVVICERRLRGAPGRRIGLSFGGGGSQPEACRDRKCVVEHDDGLMADNLIASCSDEGVYVKQSPRSRLEHNTVLDTAGVYVRYPESSATVTANLVDGAIRAREGALLYEQDNASTPLWSIYLGWHPLRKAFADADALDLQFRHPLPRVKELRSGRDLCGATTPDPALVGAFEDFAVCLRDAVR
ncbi:MAG TPA: chondroitinase-B domain-containing protein [Burkholderiaceae bacterium]|nr:chondroitinase-B domain-containing protein [Burkholderiaceae bacterium]